MPDEIIDIEEQQFAEELAKKRHKETMGALKGISSLLNKPQKENDNKDVVDAINKNIEVTKLLVQSIKEIPQPEKPEVNITVPQQEIITSLQGICDKIVASNEEVIKALNNKTLVDEFKIEKDQWGSFKTVKVIYKMNTQVMYSKPKAQA